MTETGTASEPVDKRAARREARAERLRAKAFSPVRILLSLLAIPVIGASVTVSVYIRTSPLEPPDAIRHLVALAGCEATAAVGLAPAIEGRPGYHVRNDADGDGVACDVQGAAETAAQPGAPPAADGAARMVGGAKFVRP